MGSLSPEHSLLHCGSDSKPTSPLPTPLRPFAAILAAMAGIDRNWSIFQPIDAPDVFIRR